MENGHIVLDSQMVYSMNCTLCIKIVLPQTLLRWGHKVGIM